MFPDIAFAQQRSFALRELARIGRQLPGENAFLLEATLIANPHDTNVRAILAFHYGSPHYARTGDAILAQRSHAAWWVANHPDAADRIHRCFFTLYLTDNDARGTALKLWNQHVKTSSRAEILKNAYAFMQGFSDREVLGILSKLQVLEPNELNWPFQLAHHYYYSTSESTSHAATERAKASLAYAQKALAMGPKPYQRQSIMAIAARAAYAVGDLKLVESYATNLIDTAVIRSASHSNPTYDTDIHDGHTLLGLVAVQRGDINSAVVHLMNSANAMEAPHLISFGPNMSLALELLKRGHSNEVIKFLEQCGKTWKSPDCKKWIAEIKNGIRPSARGNVRIW
jgi:hypothetical protein